jgi:phosphoadenosine phosphosulfate reductase
MLIKSHRHTNADIEMWGEQLEIDIINSNSKEFEYRERRCLENISSFLSRGRKYYACVSWGKDSIVLADMLCRSGATCPFFYIRNLSREPDGNIQVRDAFLENHDIDYREISYDYGDADDTFFNKNGDPVKWQRILGDLKQRYGVHVTGIRRDESSKRKRRFDVFGLETKYSFAPFVDFRSTDIFAYLYKHNLPVHPNYAMTGGGRWDKYRIRVAAIGNKEGDGMGRTEWEREYYQDVLNRVERLRPQ